MAAICASSSLFALALPPCASDAPEGELLASAVFVWAVAALWSAAVLLGSELWLEQWSRPPMARAVRYKLAVFRRSIGRSLSGAGRSSAGPLRSCGLALALKA